MLVLPCHGGTIPLSRWIDSRRRRPTGGAQVEAATLGMAKDLVSGAGVTQDVQQLQSAAASGVRGVAALSTRLEAGLEVRPPRGALQFCGW